MGRVIKRRGKKVVVSLCDKTGNMVRPWAEAGYQCWCIDIQHPVREPVVNGNIVYCWGDVRTWCPPILIRGNIKIIFAAPPCTHTTSSGARDFQVKGTAMLRDSLELFSACEHACKWSGRPYMIENPVGKFSDHIGEPDFTFQPWMYGEDYSKITCIWSGNGFEMPDPIVTIRPKSITQFILGMGPCKDRGDMRSAASVGFANAVYRANHNC